MFSGETGIPLGELGLIGDANPTSAEALMAGKDRVFGATSLATKFQGMISRFMPESIKAAQYDAMGQHGTRTK